jgi:hypothetical protein
MKNFLQEKIADYESESLQDYELRVQKCLRRGGWGPVGADGG